MSRRILSKIFCSSRICYFCTKTSPSSKSIKLKVPDDDAEFLEIENKKYKRDEWTNVGRSVLNSISRNLHRIKYHPLNLLTLRIRDYFYANYKKRSGNPVFSLYDNFSPVVSLWQNFDSLFVPDDHPSRKLTDTYYVNRDYVLRGHTSAHQHELISSGLDHFLVVGDVYRRDEIDRKHFPCFHQMEGVYLFNEHELFRTGDVSNQSLKLFENGVRTNEKQETHTFDCSFIVQKHLKAALEGLVKELFGQEVECKWVEAYFPFTHPSFELEVKFNDQWLETLGCGVIEQKLLHSSGAGYKVGWAFGLGLERLAMKLYEIPDIRLFWSKDSAFLRQFETDDPKKDIKYQPISKFPKKVNDMSMWLPENNENYSVNDFYDLVRTVAGDIIEQVELFDDFYNPKTNRRSHAFKITYRHMERSLPQTEISIIHNQIANQAEQQLGVTVRR